MCILKTRYVLKYKQIMNNKCYVLWKSHILDLPIDKSFLSIKRVWEFQKRAVTIIYSVTKITFCLF